MRRWEFGLLPAAIWLIVFYGYPVAGSLIQSVTSFISPERAGLDNYRWFFSTSVNLVVLERTFETALLVTAVCVVLGFPYAYLLTIVQARWRAIMLAVVLLPFWTSLLVRVSLGSDCFSREARLSAHSLRLGSRREARSGPSAESRSE